MNAFNYFLSDQSPTVVYAPYRDGDPGGGWYANYSSQPNISWTQNTLGVGTSSHTTTCPGVTASFNFTGTSVTAFGDAHSVTSYNVSCDGGKVIPVTTGWQSGTLAVCQNMTMGGHNIKITNTGEDVFALNAFHVFLELAGDTGPSNHSIQAAPPGSKRSLDSLDLQWYLPLEGETADDLIGMVMTAAQTTGNDEIAKKEVEKRILKKKVATGTEGLSKRGNYGDGSWTTTGSWNVNSDIGGGGGSNSTWYPRVTSTAATSVMIINIPANASFVALLGSVDWNHGLYEVQAWADGQQSLGTGWINFNGSSRWASINQILCTNVLDPTKSWQVAVTNLGTAPDPDWDIAELFYVDTTSSKSNSPSGSTTQSKGLSTGAIVGIAVGAAVGVAILAILAFFFWRHKKRAQRPRVGPYGTADLAEDNGDQPTPFNPPMSQRQISLRSSEMPIVSPEMGSFNSKGGISHQEEGFFQSPPESPPQSPPASNSAPGSTSGYSNQQLTSSTLPDSSATTGAPTKITRSPRPVNSPRSFRQEQDAGRVAEDEVIPPTYDPAWADHREDATDAPTQSEDSGTR